VIDVFAAHAGLPIGIARRIGHDACAPVKSDRDILTRRIRESIVAGETTVGGVEVRLENFVFGRTLRKQSRGE